MSNSQEFELDRMIGIWKWLLDPHHSERPNNLQSEELIAVFCRNILLLQNFDKLLKGAAELHSMLNHRKTSSTANPQ